MSGSNPSPNTMYPRVNLNLCLLSASRFSWTLFLFFFFLETHTGLKLEQFKSSWKAKNAMVKCLAVQFQVPESAVIITSLSAGSVIIGFEINAGTKFFF